MLCKNKRLAWQAAVDLSVSIARCNETLSVTVESSSVTLILSPDSRVETKLLNINYRLTDFLCVEQ